MQSGAIKLAAFHMGQLQKLKAEDAAWRCVARLGPFTIHEHLKAESFEDAQWSHGSGCRLHGIFEDVRAEGPEVLLAGHVKYLRA